jgi:hypothetical protein
MSIIIDKQSLLCQRRSKQVLQKFPLPAESLKFERCIKPFLFFLTAFISSKTLSVNASLNLFATHLSHFLVMLFLIFKNKFFTQLTFHHFVLTALQSCLFLAFYPLLQFEVAESLFLDVVFLNIAHLPELQHNFKLKLKVKAILI